ncbi:uncharacterized protein LOC105227464 isoform X10 [Bactrocera dorsalis]|uniref:ATP-dependent DNA helicase n=1 Tax=Bactrocera dorsalis TaxID=27457 RepID=A0ABM3J997_BACDO|nr:uncharacterized protein LOC105227464 isoform X8 [Bactrocera dorsalis]XP_049305795.1 uncharacterized protein LOC105227464 isoform X9 [Bactrocera dorsalis]XP_049305796.1 uncharacterized protein LOC105227464 isoform X10 [Bactrocera dorsalis]
MIDENNSEVIHLIDSLVSVSASQASGNIKLQTHKHTFTCYKKIVANKPQKCRFEAPFMPCRNTLNLTPMQKTDEHFQRYAKKYAEIISNLESTDYDNIDDFYEKNNIQSDDEYGNILRAGITRPKIFYKRSPTEKWHNPFNPFVFNILRSNMDFQIITEEYSCAAYVVEYVNKTNRGVSNLQRKIIEIMNEHPEFDIVDITRKMSVDILNSVEMSSQEAAWYLLREPMSKSSVVVIYINTVWPIERQRIRKTQKELSELDENSTDIWKEDWFDKYQRRPDELCDITLAQFVSKYYKNKNGVYAERVVPKVIRYRNYDIAQDYNEYRREMVTLHIPFRNEDAEILAEMKFINIYDENEALILERRKEFESNLDVEKTIEICRQLCREDGNLDDDETEIQDVANRFPEPNPFQQLYCNPNADVNIDLHLATLNKLGVIAKKKENIMELDQFCQLMRSANEKQKEFLLHVIDHILSLTSSPLQVFFTGPAGCGKTFTIKLVMEIYNRYSDNDGYCNAYITCASTGKAAVAIDGSTVHTALKISLSKLLPLSTETANQYRTLFRYVKVLIIDEVSMIGAELLAQIDARLKQITGNFETNFGGLDMIFIGDLRQLPPDRATPIYKQPKQRMAGPVLWRGLKFYQLTEVMRQSNSIFSTLLTKIGNGMILTDDELAIIESRFFTKEQADQLCPHGIRIFLTNNSVNEYNNTILQRADNKIASIATDLFFGCQSTEQEAFLKQKFHKMSVIDTGGLPYEIVFVPYKSYIITTNIDVSDGLANGAVGKLVHIEQNEQNEVTRVWLTFENSQKVGKKLRQKASAYVAVHNIDKHAVPIERRTSTIAMNNNKTINAKRNHFPLVSGWAMTIHKSQGGTFDEVVYEYERTHSLSLLNVALSRVTSINGLYIVPKNNDNRFYHGRKNDTSIISLQDEFRRLSLNTLSTIGRTILDFMNDRKKLSMVTFNCQSLRKHVSDLSDPAIDSSNILFLSETWLNDDENIDIPNFDCIAKFKRKNVRSAGVAIYQKSNDTSNIVTSNMDILLRHIREVDIGQSSIGDICAAHCFLDDGTNIIMVNVYISPNNTVNNIIKFIYRRLMIYGRVGSEELGENYHTLPLILAGDFNINFASGNGQLLINFLRDKLELQMNNDRNEPTTRHGTTIDAVFSRFLSNFNSKIYVSYFSYHKPIVSVLQSTTVITDAPNNENNEKQAKKQAKTAARRIREYRERRNDNVNMKSNNPSGNNEEQSDDIQSAGPSSKKQAKTAVQRIREYRERRKDNVNMESNNPSGNNEEQSDDIQSAGPSSKKQAKKQAKTAVQRIREYRERRKDNVNMESNNPSGNNEEQSDDIQSAGPSSKKQAKKQAKTAVQRIREYRERRKDNVNMESNNPSGNNEEQLDLCDLTLKYDDIAKHKKAHENFDRKFRKNPFGYSCTICDRLWFKNDLKKASDNYKDLLKKITNINNIKDAMICSTCKVSLEKQNIPILSWYNGFKYPEIPAQLPKLDLVTERLISPRLPFMQIRRLRLVHGQFGI